MRYINVASNLGFTLESNDRWISMRSWAQLWGWECMVAVMGGHTECWLVCRFRGGGSGAVYAGIGWGACSILCDVCRPRVVWGGLQWWLAYPAPGFRGRGVCWGLVGSSVSLMGQWPRGWLQAAGHADILFSSGYMCMCNFCGWYNVSLLFICAGRWARFAWCYNDVSVGFDGLGLCSLLVMSCLTDSNLWLQYLSRLEAIECWKIIKQFY